MDLHLRLAGQRDLTGQLYRELHKAVLEGRLKPGERVPASRELAGRLGLSRMTVTTAYDRLVGEGLFVPVQGAGTFVTTSLSTAPPAAGRGNPAAVPAQPVWSRIEGPTVFDRAAEYDLRCGLPDLARFPYDSWRRLLAHEHRPGGAAAQPYGDPAGHPALREAVAHHLATARSVAASAADVVVTTGVQQTVDLVCRAVLPGGAVVAMEDPGYKPVRLLLESSGYTVRGVPVDSEGLVVEELPDDAAAVYVTPSHQFPLGVVMSLRRRAALLDWARRRDAVIIEDDYDSEFRYGGRPLDPLHSMDVSGRVIYAGSFSKTMLPSLRIGYVVVPTHLGHAVRAAKHVMDWYGPPAAQAALARFIARGWYARHVRRMRTVYEARHRVAVRALSNGLAADLDLVPSAAGLHVGVLARGRSADACLDAVTAASACGVELFTLRLFAGDLPALAGFVIGYGAIEADDLPEALTRLGGCLTRA